MRFNIRFPCREQRVGGSRTAKESLIFHICIFSIDFHFCQLDWEMVKESWMAIKTSTALSSRQKPCCCSQNSTGAGVPPLRSPWCCQDAFTRCWTCPCGFAESQCCTHNTSNFWPICMQGQLWRHLSPGSLDSAQFWHPTAYPAFLRDNPEPQGFTPVLMSATRSCWWCGQQKWTPWSFHLGFTRETSSSPMSNPLVMILSLFHNEKNGSSAVLDLSPMATVTYSPTYCRKDLNRLTKLHTEWNKVELSESGKQKIKMKGGLRWVWKIKSMPWSSVHFTEMGHRFALSYLVTTGRKKNQSMS